MGAMSVSTRSHGAVSVLTVDDGYRNAISAEVAEELLRALRTAEDRALAVVLAGREGYFSSGLVEETFLGGGQPASDLLHIATEMILRLVEFPRPVVAACTGTALGAGAISLLGCDVRIGASGDHKIGIHYVSMGVTVPDLAIELARRRLSPRHLTIACNTARVYTPEEAVGVGYLDSVTSNDVVEEACTVAAHLAETVDPLAFAATRRVACRSLSDSIVRTSGELWGMQRRVGAGRGA